MWYVERKKRRRRRSLRQKKSKAARRSSPRCDNAEKKRLAWPLQIKKTKRKTKRLSMSVSQKERRTVQQCVESSFLFNSKAKTTTERFQINPRWLPIIIKICNANRVCLKYLMQCKQQSNPVRGDTWTCLSCSTGDLYANVTTVLLSANVWQLRTLVCGAQAASRSHR